MNRFRRHRTRRCIALIALLGLLFQQVAMAAYVCPLDFGNATTTVTAKQMTPCRSTDAVDPARCEQHCQPLAQVADHATIPPIPAIILPNTAWFHATCVVTSFRHEPVARDANPLPLTIQHCTFQI